LRDGYEDLDRDLFGWQHAHSFCSSDRLRQAAAYPAGEEPALLEAAWASLDHLGVGWVVDGWAPLPGRMVKTKHILAMLAIIAYPSYPYQPKLSHRFLSPQ